MSKAVIIDGNSLLFRVYYATFAVGKGKIMTAADGTPTNAILGFHNILHTLKSKLSAEDKMIVCFDAGKKTFRSTMLPDYKAQRKPIDNSLKVQIPISRELLEAMNIFYIEKEGFEADDLVGSFANTAQKDGYDVVIYTSDRDLLQLVDDHITVNIMQKGISVIQENTPSTILENYSLTAKQIIDFKAICGDSSDNYKGIEGVGEKTALDLIHQYGSIDEIYNNLDKLRPKLQEKFINGKEDCLLCQKIATIVTDLDISEEFKQTKLTAYDNEKLIAFYSKYNLNSLLNKIGAKVQTTNVTKAPDNIIKEYQFGEVVYVESFKEIEHNPTSIFAITSEKNENNAELRQLIFSNGKINYVLALEQWYDDKDLISYLKSDNEKYTNDLKALNVVLANSGLPFLNNCVFDLSLADYIIDPDSELNFTDYLSKHFKLNFASLSLIDTRACFCQLISNVYEDKINILKESNQYDLLKNIEIPLSYVLSKMEIEGMYCSKEFLSEQANKVKLLVEEYKNKILEYTDNKSLNVNSPIQLAKLLYQELKLGDGKETKDTSNLALLKIKEQSPVVELIIEYRKYYKMLSTYLLALQEHINEDGKIHAIFNQTLTATGRLSMSEPNLQNISIRSEETKVMRKAFEVPQGYQLFSFDYSQIELRIMASLSNDEHMTTFFNNKLDVHTATASKVFNIPYEEVTKEQRRKAKAVNFGIIYGISSKGLADDLEISMKEAKALIDSFKKEFPSITSYRQQIIDEAKKTEKVETIRKRVRFLPQFSKGNFHEKSFAERAAVNTVIQGSAADIIKMAMINIDSKLSSYKTKLILQIHDELIFIAPNEEVEKVMQIVKQEMENVISLNVKLEVEGSHATNWYDLK